MIMSQATIDPAKLDEVLGGITPDRLMELTVMLVDVASPTGGELPLARVIGTLLTKMGLESHVQPIDDRQGSAWGRLRSTRTSPDLLLYAPIDTLSSGDAAHDLPWAGEVMADHMWPQALVDGDVIRGLGAMNPKGHAACVLAAAEVLAAAAVPLTGDVLVAFGAGGMPANADPGSDRQHIGQGVGASFLLEQGVWADQALIAKSHWAVSRQEVGLAWVDVTVHGLHSYVGARHRIDYRNPIGEAAGLVQRLEAWLRDTYPRDHTTGEVAPQGVVSAIDGGLPQVAATVPASCRLRLDLRLAPDQSPLSARREVAAVVEEWADKTGVRTDVELALAIPGSQTPADAPVVQACIAAWEREEGRDHTAPTGQSGATDANILRNRGIPTARIGLPKVQVDGGELDFAAGMNTVTADSMVRLTRVLVHTALILCSSTKETT